MKGLYYTRVSEMLGEKFHIDEAFLKQSIQQQHSKAGEKSLFQTYAMIYQKTFI